MAKHIPLKLNNIDYNFKIGKGIAGINFDYSLQDVLKLLGKPDKKQEDSVSLYLEYRQYGLFLSYEKENKELIDLGIGTEQLIYEGKNWYNFNKNELIGIIKNIYKKKNYTFDFETSEIECINEEQLDFYEIGVTLFFNKNKLESVDISKPII